VSAARARDAKRALLEKQDRDALDVGKQQRHVQHHALTDSSALRSTTPKRTAGNALLPTTPRQRNDARAEKRFASSPRGGVSGANLDWWMSRAHQDIAYVRNQ
jgi:hypothetical protein